MTRKNVRWTEAKRKYPLIQAYRGVPVRLFQRTGNWYADWEIDGHRRQRSLKTQSESIASIRARELSEQLSKGAPAPQAPKIRSANAIYQQFLGWAQERLRPKTVTGYRYHVERFLQTVKPADLSAITSAEIERYKTTITGGRRKKDDRAPERVSNATIDRHVAGISAFLEYARRMGYIESNPARGLRREARRSRNSPIYATKEDVTKILAVAGPYRIAVALGFYAGLRLGEMIHLMWRDVNLADRRLMIRPHAELGWKPKSHQRRTIPISSDLAAILEEAPEKDRGGRLWPPGESWHNNLAWKQWLKKRKLPRINIQDLRHSFGTYAAAAGIALRTLQEWMGHASIQTTQRYMAYVPGQEAEIEKLNL